MVSQHYKNERCSREDFIKERLGGDGRVVDSFIIDKGHIKGLERHDITDNGIIIIYNAVSKKLISKLIARPQQIKRYYKYTGRQPPEEYKSVLKLAKLHEILGYNKI